MHLNRGACKTMKGNEKAWYAAFKSKDARFDGHFFVGVVSAGIYCRPICRTKLPRPGNCTLCYGGGSGTGRIPASPGLEAVGSMPPSIYGIH